MSDTSRVTINIDLVFDVGEEEREGIVKRLKGDSKDLVVTLLDSFIEYGILEERLEIKNIEVSE